MPDIHGLLSAADHEIIRRWWEGHWKAPVVCPVCKTTEWEQGPHVVNVQRFAVDSMAPGTPTYTHVIVGCKNCGHVMFFNSAKIGIPQPVAQDAPSSAANALLDTPPSHSSPLLERKA